MRKSQSSSVRHFGALEDTQAIVPPAAAKFDKVLRPENDPILRQVLSPEELADLAENRQMHLQNKRSRLHTHDDQVRKDRIREHALNAQVRQMQQTAPSAAGRRRSRTDGELFNLGKATPVFEEEEFQPLDEMVPGLQGGGVITRYQQDGDFDGEPETPSEWGGLAPVSADNAVGEGGAAHFTSSLGKNLRPTQPSRPRRRLTVPPTPPTMENAGVEVGQLEVSMPLEDPPTPPSMQEKTGPLFGGLEEEPPSPPTVKAEKMPVPEEKQTTTKASKKNSQKSSKK